MTSSYIIIGHNSNILVKNDKVRSEKSKTQSLSKRFYLLESMKRDPQLPRSKSDNKNCLWNMSFKNPLIDESPECFKRFTDQEVVLGIAIEGITVRIVASYKEFSAKMLSYAKDTRFAWIFNTFTSSQKLCESQHPLLSDYFGLQSSFDKT